MDFATRVDQKWEEDDRRYNERYYTESVALMILFRHMEGLIPKQEWYESGYRANIVTYSLALLRYLIKKQFRGYDLDLQSIWLRQNIPDILTKVLENIAEKVYYKITDPKRATVNVTQWCKREACWKGVQEIQVSLPEELVAVLIGKEAQTSAERDAKKDQKLISDTEAQTKVLQYSAEQWTHITRFAVEKKIVSADDVNALRIACQLPQKLPNPYQSRRLVALLERVMAEGYTP